MFPSSQARRDDLEHAFAYRGTADLGWDVDGMPSVTQSVFQGGQAVQERFAGVAFPDQVNTHAVRDSSAALISAASPSSPPFDVLADSDEDDFSDFGELDLHRPGAHAVQRSASPAGLLSESIPSSATERARAPSSTCSSPRTALRSEYRPATSDLRSPLLVRPDEPDESAERIAVAAEQRAEQGICTSTSNTRSTRTRDVATAAVTLAGLASSIQIGPSSTPPRQPLRVLHPLPGQSRVALSPFRHRPAALLTKQQPIAIATDNSPTYRSPTPIRPPPSAPLSVWPLKAALADTAARQYRGPLGADTVLSLLSSAISTNGRLALTSDNRTGYLRYCHYLGPGTEGNLPAKKQRLLSSAKVAANDEVSNLSKHLYGTKTRIGCLDRRAETPAEPFPAPLRHADGSLVQEGAGTTARREPRPRAKAALSLEHGASAQFAASSSTTDGFPLTAATYPFTINASLLTAAASSSASDPALPTVTVSASAAEGPAFVT
ncbi:hypothetical protein V8E36_003233 [Tilletia maclaganii]